MTIDPGAVEDTTRTTREDVITWYNRYLGRPPEDEGAIVGRVGYPRGLIELDLYNSPEAVARRAEIARQEQAQREREQHREGERNPPPYQPPYQPKVDINPIVGDIAEKVVNTILPGLGTTIRRLDELSGGLGGRIAEDVARLTGPTLAVGARITEGLAASLAQAIPNMLEVAAEAANRAADIAEGFAAQAASVVDVAGAFGSEVGKHKDALITGAASAVGGGIASGLLDMLFQVETDHPSQLDAVLGLVRNNPDVPENLKDAFQLRSGETTPLHLIVGGALLVGAAAQVAGSSLAPYIELIRQGVYTRDPVWKISAPEAAALVARQLRDYPDMQKLAQVQGFDEGQFRMLADLAFQYIPPEAVITAWLRGDATDEQTDRLLNRHGLDAENREILRKLALQLPGVQDLIRMAVREVFSPARQTLTLDADYPEILTEHARRIGLSEEWSRNFWAAHWELPSVNQVFAMLHRGDIKDLQEVRDFLKAADYAPVWRDRLINLSYDVFTRVDIRRIHDLRNKDHAWLVQQHKRLGYNDADAEELSVFVELLNSDERKQKKRDLSASLVSRIQSAFISGTLTRYAAETWLQGLGFSELEVETYMTDAVMLRDERQAERTTQLIGDLYVKGRRTADEVRTELKTRGFLDIEISHFLRQWDLERELRAPTEREETQRDLTRTDIEQGYRARKLTKERALELLASLRYDAVEAAFILEMADYKEAQEIQKDQIEVVHRRFVKGSIDKTKATQELDAVVDRTTQRDALLARWETEISAKTSELSVAQVGEVYKIGHWQDAQVKAYLKRLGYDDEETSALLATWGSKIEAAKARETEAARKKAEAAERERQRVLDAARRADKALAVGQLLSAGAAEVLSWVEVRAELIGKGYSGSEADTLIKTKQAQGVKKGA